MILPKFTMSHGVHVGHTSTLYMHVYMYVYVRDCIVLVDQCLGPGFVLYIEFTWHNASHDTTLDHMMSHDPCVQGEVSIQWLCGPQHQDMGHGVV